mgnify:CR=1 FL=1
MMKVSEAAFALGVAHRGGDPLFTSAGTDSRDVRPGQLFIALRGKHFDAHQYIDAARGAGAVAVMVDVQGAAHVPVDMPAIVVNDTRQGLTQLAYAWRSRFTGPLAALTGSSGKTTVKEMLAAIMREVYGDGVLATHGNLNNDIGVPLTLLELREHHRCAVIELGMNHAGEIRALTRLARPDVALINNAGRAHIEHLGSVEAIARAKDRGLKITCDTAPPYFALNDLAVGDYRTFGKLVPPLRAEQDRLAVIEGLKSGVIDAIVSDHRPQDQESKRVPFAQAEPGGIGLETLLPVSLELVHNKHLTLPQLFQRLSTMPARLFGLPGGRLAKGAPADLIVFDADYAWKIDRVHFRSKTKNSPFDERPAQGRVMATIVAGRTIYRADGFVAAAAA